MRKVLSSLGIDSFGWYELLFAMYLIFAGYRFGSIPMSALMLVIMALIALFKGAKPVFDPIIIGLVFAYVIIHDVLLWLILPSPPAYMISNIIVNFITVFALYIILCALDFHKTVSMIYLVTIATLIGLFYHVALIQAGQMVQPIRLPFMPEMDSSSRAFEEGFRPKSFFWEPAACITFLMVPFFISILQKRWVWVAVLMFSMFISTSTNGIVLSVITLGLYILMTKGKLQYKFLVAIIMVGMLYVFFNTDMFEFGRDKMLNTKVEDNARLSNGPLIIQRADPSSLIFGVPSANAFDYIRDNNISTNGLVIDENSIFIPTFWSLLLNYGIVGLCMYFAIYWTLIKKDKRLIPYVIALMASTFVQSIGFGANFVFQIICMLLIIKSKNHLIIKSKKKIVSNESSYVNNSECQKHGRTTTVLCVK